MPIDSKKLRALLAKMQTTASVLPDAKFGRGDHKCDWRSMPDDSPDDDELLTTPPEVIDMIGFDPMDFDGDDS